MIWYTGTLSVLAYSVILTMYLLRRRRLCFDVPEGNKNIKVYVLGRVFFIL